jgi:hypothetical protein
MLVNPSIESLRDQITRDRECFKAQSQRLVEIQQSDPNVLSDIDRNTLSHWDKSVVTDCNRQLLLLEEVKQPSAEERAIMKEFHELIILGDHIMEKRNLVRAELNDGLNAVKKSKASKPTPVTNEKAEPVATPLRDTSEGIGRKANVVTPRSTIDTVPDAVSMPPTGAKLPHASTASYSNNLKVGRIHDSTDVEAIDPKILYDTLRVEPDASLNDIKKYDPLAKFDHELLTMIKGYEEDHPASAPRPQPG